MTETELAWPHIEPITLTEDHILSVLLVRRAREEALGENLFSDPAWDILLELFAARLGSRNVTTADLVTAIRAPVSTAVRWIAVLQQRGLLQSAVIGAENQPIELTPEGVARMERLGSRWASAFRAIT